MDVGAGGVSVEAGQVGFVERLAAGLKNPVASTRALLAERPSESVLLSLLMIAGLFRLMGAAFKTVAAPPPPEVDPAEHLSSAMLEAAIGAFFVFPIGVYLAAALAKMVLGLFGGVADWREARVGAVWGAVLAAPILLLSDAAAALAGATVAGLPFGLIALYYFCAAVAVAHGFRTGLGLFAPLAIAVAAVWLVFGGLR